MTPHVTHFDDIALPECQAMLRQVRDAILRNKFSAPAMPLSPKLARRLAQFRASVLADVYVLGISADRVMALGVPHDGGDLFVEELRHD